MAFFQPFAPYLQYALNKDFIAAKWCVNREVQDSTCQGKCFLNSELSRTANSHADGSAQVQTEILSLAPHGPQTAKVTLVNSVFFWLEAVSTGPYTPPYAGLITPPPQA